MAIERTVGIMVTAKLLYLLHKLGIESGQKAFNPLGQYGVASKNIEAYTKRVYAVLGWKNEQEKK